MAELVQTFIPFVAKRSGNQRLIEGPITADTVDIDGQSMDPEWLKSALPAWMQYGNIREQHIPTRAVGKAQNLNIADISSPRILAKISDDPCWQKIEDGTYSGFSLGIRNARFVHDGRAPNGTVVGGDIIEVSVVDHPAVRSAAFNIVQKVAGGWKDAQSGIVVEDPTQADRIRAYQESLTPEVQKSLSQEARDKIPAEDFAGPHRSFPIDSEKHAQSAAMLAGHAEDPDAVRANIIRKAKKKGFKVPESLRKRSVEKMPNYFDEEGNPVDSLTLLKAAEAEVKEKAAKHAHAHDHEYEHAHAHSHPDGENALNHEHAHGHGYEHTHDHDHGDGDGDEDDHDHEHEHELIHEHEHEHEHDREHDHYHGGTDDAQEDGDMDNADDEAFKCPRCHKDARECECFSTTNKAAADFVGFTDNTKPIRAGHPVPKGQATSVSGRSAMHDPSGANAPFDGGDASVRLDYIIKKAEHLVNRMESALKSDNDANFNPNNTEKDTKPMPDGDPNEGMGGLPSAEQRWHGSKANDSSKMLNKAAQDEVYEIAADVCTIALQEFFADNEFITKGATPDTTKAALASLIKTVATDVAWNVASNMFDQLEQRVAQVEKMPMPSKGVAAVPPVVPSMPYQQLGPQEQRAIDIGINKVISGLHDTEQSQILAEAIKTSWGSPRPFATQ